MRNGSQLRGAPDPPESVEERGAEIASIPWWHSIDLGDGLTTPGKKSPARLARELARMQLPDLQGKSVLDIGAWDGFFSFAAERLGASRVVAVDHYMWSLDPQKPAPPSRVGWDRQLLEGSSAWDPVGLPGKRGFDFAHRCLGSKVESFAVDFMHTDPAELGTFDVVFFLGVLYHMPDPLGSMRRISELTRELAIVETEAIYVPGREDRGLLEFFEWDELGGDPTNWYAPNACAVEKMARAAGFARVRNLSPSLRSRRIRRWREKLFRYRAHFHLEKSSA